MIFYSLTQNVMLKWILMNRKVLVPFSILFAMTSTSISQQIREIIS